MKDEDRDGTRLFAVLLVAATLCVTAVGAFVTSRLCEHLWHESYACLGSELPLPAEVVYDMVHEPLLSLSALLLPMLVAASGLWARRRKRVLLAATLLVVAPHLAAFESALALAGLLFPAYWFLPRCK